MTPKDLDAIAFVAALRHRIGTKRSCKCEQCRALTRVVSLARRAGKKPLALDAGVRKTA